MSSGNRYLILLIVPIFCFFFPQKALHHWPAPLTPHLPNIMRWMTHMLSLRTVKEAGEGLSWRCRGGHTDGGGGGSSIRFSVDSNVSVEEDEMELRYMDLL